MIHPRNLLPLASLALALPAAADVVTIPASKDNTLYEDATGGTSNGSGDHFFVGRAGSLATTPVRRGVIAFDVAGNVPAGSRIQSVELTLHMSMTPSGAQDVDVYRLTQDWGEGASHAPGQEGAGAPSAAGDATWIHTFFPGSFWNNAGGDFLPAIHATQSVSFIGFYDWTSPDMADDVQDWLDTPASNFGWILRSVEDTDFMVKRFDSKDNADPGLRPALTIEFTPPPVTYCTAKTNSQGCTPAMDWTGFPSTSAGSGFDVFATDVLNNKSGLLFYGLSGRAAIAFQGGTLCVRPPTQRTPVQSSGGNPPPNDCSGQFHLDFNARIASGIDPALVAGAVVNAQYWSRDPQASFGTNLTDALEFTIAP